VGTFEDESTEQQRFQFLKALFYFSHAGSLLQKSLTECLGSMLYQLLSPRPQVIDTIDYAKRRSDAIFGRDSPLERFEEEVTGALLTFMAYRPDK
jgi:hypothetical protein